MQAEDREALEKVAAFESERSERLGKAWLRHMRAGEFQAAWRVSDEVARLRSGQNCANRPRHLQWVWKGGSLEGKRVLIRCYHGLGDTIHFIRYAPLVRGIAREVAVWAQPELVPLLGTMKNAFDELRPLHAGEAGWNFDVDVELMELPYVFRTSPGSLPADVPYLHVAPTTLPRNGRLNVGLVWQAGEWDERRSIPLETISGLASSVDVNWHVLQRGPGLAGWEQSFGINSGSDDVFATAQVIAALDLLISVDSMPAHLGGALAVPTWTLLHAEPDWRWMERGARSPWYPTMRLFRQECGGDWEQVIETVARELARKAADAA